MSGYAIIVNDYHVSQRNSVLCFGGCIDAGKNILRVLKVKCEKENCESEAILCIECVLIENMVITMCGNVEVCPYDIYITMLDSDVFQMSLDYVTRV